VEDTLVALNELGGFVDALVYPDSPLNEAQHSAISNIYAAHLRRPNFVKRNPDAAFRELLRARPGYTSTGGLAPFRADSVSLPNDQVTPDDLSALLNTSDAEQLESFRELLIDDLTFSDLTDVADQSECYMDPGLVGDPMVYAQFVKRLYSCGVIEFTCQPKVQVGIFFVYKTM
jgi:hypothetical protein